MAKVIHLEQAKRPATAFSEGRWVARGVYYRPLVIVSIADDGTLLNDICTLYSVPMDKRPERQANAHLITAAPDLYRHLERVEIILRAIPDQDKNWADRMALVEAGTIARTLNRARGGLF